MYAWAGTILRVNLTNHEVVRDPLKADFARKWLGGEGFGAKLLWDEVGPEVEDGLDPRNVLVYASGPLTSTLAPGCGRLEIVTKSPITGIFGDSNCGGHFAPEFKQAGYDAIVIEGRADKPVYLWIDNDHVEIRDAVRLWGKTVPETDELIKEELGDKNIQVSCIGPAGENLVRFAILVNNLVRAPGWTGCGAVAGSKNLKAVAVRGTKGVRIARPDEFEQACWEARQKLLKLASLPTSRLMGTMYLIAMMQMRGWSHVQNFNITTCPHFEQVRGEKWAEEFVVKTLGCHGCEVHCSHFCVIKEGPYAGHMGEGYEYGSIGAYVFWYGSPSLPFAMAASKYCNDYGLDASEPGMLLAWATDCFKRGILTEKDTDGLVLDWGDERVALEVLKRITHRQGFGNLLAEGLSRAASKLGRGSQAYAHTIKGRASYESPSRGSYGRALSAATSTRGADHLKGYPTIEGRASPEMAKNLFGDARATDGRSPEAKAAMAADNRLICTITDIMGTCKFSSRWLQPFDGLTEADYARMTAAATGLDLTAEELMTVARRVYTLEHAYNVRLGLNRKDDTLPEIFFEQPFNAGPLKGFVYNKQDFDRMLDEHYQHWGWDVQTGIPTRKTLEVLGMKDVADELEMRGYLSKRKPEKRRAKAVASRP